MGGFAASWMFEFSVGVGNLELVAFPLSRYLASGVSALLLVWGVISLLGRAAARKLSTRVVLTPQELSLPVIHGRAAEYLTFAFKDVRELWEKTEDDERTLVFLLPSKSVEVEESALVEAGAYDAIARAARAVIPPNP
ncbi:MAG: hypothetical protein AAGE52_00200 [Myxococcota bacterium]